MQMTKPFIHKSGAKKVLLALLVTSLTPGLQGCTDQEFATGVAVVAVGAAAVAIGAAASNRDRHDNRDHRDHRGNGGWDRRGPRNGGGWHRISAVDLGERATAAVAVTGVENNVATVTADNFADTFSMNVEASARVLGALEAARAGDASKLAELGLDASELRRIGEYRMPSADAIAVMSSRLDQDRDTLASMLQQLISIAQAKQQEISSHQ